MNISETESKRVLKWKLVMRIMKLMVIMKMIKMMVMKRMMYHFSCKEKL